MTEKKLEAVFADSATPPPGLTVRRESGTSDITFRNIKLTRPDDGATLIDTFSLTLKQGERLMLTGPRGCGKSSLMRAIGGLWDSGSGEIILPADKRILAVPQKPYLPDIPLRNILCYPDDIKFTDEQMAEALKSVGLARLTEGPLQDTEHTGTYWATRFSLGEQQALIFARIFLFKPDVLMIDEVSAALDEESEQKLYGAMLEKLPDTTIISISHHRKMIPFHTLHGDIQGGVLTVKPTAPAPVINPPSPV